MKKTLMATLIFGLFFIITFTVNSQTLKKNQIQGKAVIYKGKKCIETTLKEIFCDGIKYQVVHDEKQNSVPAQDGFGFIRKTYSLDSDANRIWDRYQKANNIDRHIWMFSKISPKALDYAIQRSDKLSRRGKTSIRFEIRDGDCSVGKNGQLNDCRTNRERSELSHMWLAPLNEIVYYAYSMYLPTDYKEMDNPYQILGQFHDNEANNFSNQYMAGRMYINVKYNHHDRAHIYLTDFTKGKWHDFIYKIKWSKTSKGYIEVTMDNKTIFIYKGQNISDSSNTGPYFKIGNYRSHLERYKHGKHPTQIVYYDEFRYGKTFESVSYEHNKPLD